jgi:hypothetical protein
MFAACAFKLFEDGINSRVKRADFLTDALAYQEPECKNRQGVMLHSRINTETIFQPTSDWYVWRKSIPKRWLMWHMASSSTF